MCSGIVKASILLVESALISICPEEQSGNLRRRPAHLVTDRLQGYIGTARLWWAHHRRGHRWSSETASAWRSAVIHHKRASRYVVLGEISLSPFTTYIFSKMLLTIISISVILQIAATWNYLVIYSFFNIGFPERDWTSFTGFSLHPKWFLRLG